MVVLAAAIGRYPVAVLSDCTVYAAGGQSGTSRPARRTMEHRKSCWDDSSSSGTARSKAAGTASGSTTWWLWPWPDPWW
ncbi:hypothetical protein [Streptomyces prasinus]|uniref:Uncharacterized protein n=1 Tax=Streptomyces prasinus TaxID=67345 RepID=A0ABX6APS6_9ACTN|nr:hypothetical protein [Streptomyces prasinus]QEV04418.1 hypothetical protein CP972_00115 [Streptomyces prasinus]